MRLANCGYLCSLCIFTLAIKTLARVYTNKRQVHVVHQQFWKKGRNFWKLFCLRWLKFQKFMKVIEFIFNKTEKKNHYDHPHIAVDIILQKKRRKKYIIKNWIKQKIIFKNRTRLMCESIRTAKNHKIKNK